MTSHLPQGTALSQDCVKLCHVFLAVSGPPCAPRQRTLLAHKMPVTRGLVNSSSLVGRESPSGPVHPDCPVVPDRRRDGERALAPPDSASVTMCPFPEPMLGGGPWRREPEGPAGLICRPGFLGRAVGSRRRSLPANQGHKCQPSAE